MPEIGLPPGVALAKARIDSIPADDLKVFNIYRGILDLCDQHSHHEGILACCFVVAAILRPNRLSLDDFLAYVVTAWEATPGPDPAPEYMESNLPTV